jgi:SCY1-like protein 1
MGTPANDTSWAGWAISSFTNKLSAASGDIRAGTTNGDSTQRPSSVPPPASAKNDTPPVPVHSKPGMLLNKSSASIPSISPPAAVTDFNDNTDDFNDDWGGFGDTESKPKVEDDMWADPEETTTSTATTSTSKTYDDKGEPDFAGWLAAQSAAKKPAAKNPLPKGLGKTTTTKSTRPIIGGRSSTTGSAATRKIVAAPKKEEPKKEAPKVQEKKTDDDGWGDDW